MTIRKTVKMVLDGDTFQTYRKIRGSNFIRIAGKHARIHGHKTGNNQSAIRKQNPIPPISRQGAIFSRAA